MSRSKSKLVFVHRSQFPKFFYNQKKKKLRRKLYGYINEKGVNIGAFYFFWKRASVINRRLVNRRFALYNGYLFHVVRTTESNLGYKLGEFTATRRSVIHKGKQRQKKKRDLRVKNVYAVNKYSPFFKKSGKKVSNRQKVREQKRNK